jgi:hypothetical protein
MAEGIEAVLGEAFASLGNGGIRLVARLDGGVDGLAWARGIGSHVRAVVAGARPGGGRSPLTEPVRGLVPTLLELVESEQAG